MTTTTVERVLDERLDPFPDLPPGQEARNDITARRVDELRALRRRVLAGGGRTGPLTAAILLRALEWLEWGGWRDEAAEIIEILQPCIESRADRILQERAERLRKKIQRRGLHLV